MFYMLNNTQVTTTYNLTEFKIFTCQTEISIKDA